MQGNFEDELLFSTPWAQTQSRLRGDFNRGTELLTLVSEFKLRFIVC